MPSHTVSLQSVIVFLNLVHPRNRNKVTGDLEAIEVSLHVCVCVSPRTRVTQGAWRVWAWQELWDISRIAFFLAVLSEMAAGWVCMGFSTLCQ